MPCYRDIEIQYDFKEVLDMNYALNRGDVLTFGLVDPNLIETNEVGTTHRWCPGESPTGWVVSAYEGYKVRELHREYPYAKFWKLPRIIKSRRLPLNKIHSEPVPLP